jgi:uncharacterized membrane protein
MISAHFDAQAGLGRIILQPNRPWSWRANSYFVVTLLGVSLAVASSFALRGYWLVLPFSILEMAALFGCLYYCVRRATVQEVLTFSADELTVETGHQRPERVYRYQRFFTRFSVEPPAHPWYQPRIEIRDRERRLEIGRFLRADEKRDLVAELRNMIHMLRVH